MSSRGRNDADLRFNAVLEDNVSPQVDAIVAKMQKLGASKHEIKIFIRAYDEATVKAQQVQTTLKNIPNQKQIKITVDHAKAMADMGHFRRAMEKPIDVAVRVKSNLSEESAKIKSFFSNIRNEIANEVSNIPILPQLARGGASLVNMGANSIGLPALTSTAAVGAIGYQSFQQNMQMEQDMMSLRTTLKDLASARDEMATVTRFARLTPFNQPDVLQADIQMRQYGIRPGGPVGLHAAGDLAAGTGSDLNRSMLAIIDATRRGDFRVARGMGLNVDASSFAPGGRFAGQSIEQGLGKLIEQKFGGAIKDQALTFKGLSSNIQDVVNLNVMRPMGTTAFNIAKQSLVGLNDRLTGSSPQAVETQRAIGDAVEKVNETISRMYELIRQGRTYFNSYLKQPIIEIAQTLTGLGKTFTDTFGSGVITGVKYLAQALQMVLTPISRLAGSMPILTQAFALMKVFQVFGNDKMAAPFERFFGAINPLSFSLKNLFGSMKDLLFLAPRLMMMFAVKNIIDMKSGTDALTNAWKRFGDEGSNALDRLNLKLDAMSGGLDQNAGKLKGIAAEFMNSVPTGTNPKAAMSFAGESAINAAKLEYQGFGGTTARQLYMEAEKRANVYSQGGSGADKVYHEFMSAARGVADALNVDLETAVKKMAESMNMFSSTLKPRVGAIGDTPRGWEFTTDLYNAAKTVPIPKNMILGKSPLGTVSSAQELVQRLLEDQIPSRRVLSHVYKNNPNFDISNILSFNSLLTPQNDKRRTKLDQEQVGENKRIGQLSAYDKQISNLIGMNVQLPKDHGMFDKYNVGINMSKMINPNDAIKEWMRFSDVTDQVSKASEKAAQDMQLLNQKQEQLSQGQAQVNDLMSQYAFAHLVPVQRAMAALNNEMSIYTQENIVPIQRKQEDFNFVIRQTSRALEDVSYKMGQAQYQMTRYSESMFTGDQAINDQIHSLDMYTKRIQYLRLLNTGMMADLTTTTFTEGYKSVVKPLAGFSLERMSEITDRKRQRADLEKELRVVDGKSIGDWEYLISKAARTGTQGTEMDPRTKLNNIRDAARVITEGTIQSNKLTIQQHAQTLQSRELEDAMYHATVGLRHYQDQQYHLERSAYAAATGMYKFEDANEHARHAAYNLSRQIYSLNKDLQQLEGLQDLSRLQAKGVFDFLKANLNDQTPAQLRKYIESIKDILGPQLEKALLQGTKNVGKGPTKEMISDFERAADQIKNSIFGIFSGQTFVKIGDMVKQGFDSIGLPGFIASGLGISAGVWSAGIAANTARIVLKRAAIQAVAAPFANAMINPEGGVLQRGAIRLRDWSKRQEPLMRPPEMAMAPEEAYTTLGRTWMSTPMGRFYNRAQFMRPGRFMGGLATQGIIGGLVGGITGSLPLGILSGVLSGYAVEQQLKGGLSRELLFGPHGFRGEGFGLRSIPRAVAGAYRAVRDNTPLEERLQARAEKAWFATEDALAKVNPSKLTEAADKVMASLQSTVSRTERLAKISESITKTAASAEEIAKNSSVLARVVNSLTVLRPKFLTRSISEGLDEVGARRASLAEDYAAFRARGVLPEALSATRGASRLSRGVRGLGRGIGSFLKGGAVAGAFLGGLSGNIPNALEMADPTAIIPGFKGIMATIFDALGIEPGNYSGEAANTGFDPRSMAGKTGAFQSKMQDLSTLGLTHPKSAIRQQLKLVGNFETMMGSEAPFANDSDAQKFIAQMDKMKEQLKTSLGTMETEEKAHARERRDIQKKFAADTAMIEKGMHDHNNKLAGEGYKKLAKLTGANLNTIKKTAQHLGYETGKDYADSMLDALRRKMGDFSQGGASQAADPHGVLKQLQKITDPQQYAQYVNSLAGPDKSSPQDAMVSKFKKIENSTSSHLQKMQGFYNTFNTTVTDNQKKDFWDPLSNLRQTSFGDENTSYDSHLQNIQTKISDYYDPNKGTVPDTYRKGWQDIGATTHTWLGKVEKEINNISGDLGITSNTTKHAHGGVVDGRNTGRGRLVTVGEEGYPEMIIPLAPHRRDRAQELMAQTAAYLGQHKNVHEAVPRFDNGGLTGPVPTAAQNKMFMRVVGDAWQYVNARAGAPVDGSPTFSTAFMPDRTGQTVRANDGSPPAVTYNPTVEQMMFGTYRPYASKNQSLKNAINIILHEMVHAKQSMSTINDPTTAEGGAVSWAEGHTRDFLMSEYGKKVGPGGFWMTDDYKAKAAYVRKNLGKDWINSTQFYAAGGLSSPFPMSAIVQDQRTDMGKDFELKLNTIIHAIGAGTVGVSQDESGWGSFTAMRLDKRIKRALPGAGRGIFVGHQRAIPGTTRLAAGQPWVKVGNTAFHDPMHVEIGWANSAGTDTLSKSPEAKLHGFVYPDSVRDQQPEGKDFEQFLNDLLHGRIKQYNIIPKPPKKLLQMGMAGNLLYKDYKKMAKKWANSPNISGVSTGGAVPQAVKDIAHDSSHRFSFRELEALWKAAGGPSSAAHIMARVAIAESGGIPTASYGGHKPADGVHWATGLWQILGLPNGVSGNPQDPWTNALMAVAKYKGAGGLSPWTSSLGLWSSGYTDQQLIKLRGATYANGGMDWGGWHAKGLDKTFNKPTLIGVGENGPEHVSVSPLGKFKPDAPMWQWLKNKIESMDKNLFGIHDTLSKQEAKALANTVRGMGIHQNIGALVNKKYGHKGLQGMSDALDSESAHFDITARGLNKHFGNLKKAHGHAKGTIHAIRGMDAHELGAALERSKNRVESDKNAIAKIKKGGVTKKEEKRLKSLQGHLHNDTTDMHLYSKAFARDAKWYSSIAKSRGVGAGIVTSVIHGARDPIHNLLSDHDVTAWGQVRGKELTRAKSLAGHVIDDKKVKTHHKDEKKPDYGKNVRGTSHEKIQAQQHREILDQHRKNRSTMINAAAQSTRKTTDKLGKSETQLDVVKQNTADNVKATKALLSMPTTTKQLSNINAELNKHTTQFSGVNAELNRHTEQFKGVNAELNKHTEQFKGVNAELNTHTTQFSGVNAELNKHTVRFDGVKSLLGDISNKLTNVNAELNKHTDHLEGLHRGFKNVYPKQNFAGGMNRVPYDGYAAFLHQDEMVLQAGEANQYRARKATGFGMTSNGGRVEELLSKMVNSLEDIKTKPDGDIQIVNSAQGAALNTRVTRTPKRTR